MNKEAMTLKQRIYYILSELGITDDLLGKKYLTDAIALCIEDDTIMENFCKVVYAEIAENNCRPISTIERNMRFAVEKCFEKCPPEILHEFFGNMISVDNGKVKVKQFVGTIVRRIELGLS